MKKIAFLGVMIFIILPKIFTDENRSEVQKCYFTWQLYNYYKNSSDNFLLLYSIENGVLNINFLNDYYNRYLADSERPSFINYIYSIDETLGDYVYFQYQIFKFIDGISGSPERRHREQLESNRRYNILHPDEPLRR